MTKFVPIVAAAALAFAGCVSVDREAARAIGALKSGNPAPAVKWGEELATDSHYTKNLGMVEAGRANMLAGDWAAAEKWFRAGVDTAVDRKETNPKINCGDVANTMVAATITDDRTREYYLPPYELNLALEYGILAQLFNGKIEDATVDARLAVYVQDHIADQYGADLAKQKEGGRVESDRMYERQSANLQELIRNTRNSWENPFLWWLTGVLFESQGDTETAGASYRKAAAICPVNPFFAADAQRAGGEKLPRKDEAKLIVIYDRGFVPMRTSVKVPVPIYTAMAVDLPTYDERPLPIGRVTVAGAKGESAAALAVDIQALAARDLDEKLPGIILRNITRAAVQAGAQVAANANGNEYAQLAVLAGNLVASSLRRADTRSWRTLPSSQQVWCDNAMKPGEYRLGMSVDGVGCPLSVKLQAGKTTVVWVADYGCGPKTASVTF